MLYGMVGRTLDKRASLSMSELRLAFADEIV